MFSVEIEDSTLSENAAHKRRITGFAARARAALQRAVNRERDGHQYRNRTYAAQSNTKLSTHQDTDNATDITAGMVVEYASYLNDSGWSRFDDLVRAALDAIDDDARKLP